MLRLRRRAVSLVVFLFAFCCPGSSFAQDPMGIGSRSHPGPGGPGRTFAVQVHDAGGLPLQGAVAIIGDLWVEQADSQGVVRFDSRPGLHLPVMVQVKARGFLTRQILLDGTERSTDVYLEPDQKEAAGAGAVGGKTVSVAELAPDNQRMSRRLQTDALEALAQQENGRAEKLLRKAIELTPSSPSIQNNLGVALLRQGKFDEAAPYFEKGYEMQPLDATAAGNLGLIRWMQRRSDESYMLLDRALALGFSAPSAHYYLGILALGKTHWKQAIEHLDRTSPERFPYRDLYRTFALRGLGEERQASQTFLQFIRRVPVALFRFAWTGRADDSTALGLTHR